MIHKTICTWLLSLSLLLLTENNRAEIYHWNDAQGRAHFSDKKHANATEYEITENYSFYKVKKVYDGDTVLLTDGRKIRLLGINAPEIEHTNQGAQAGGEDARKWLSKQILGTKIRLEFDQKKNDKYKRYLAHIFTEQEVHINRELVRLGFASTNIFPPNLKYVTELHMAEQTAESKHLGIWGFPEYHVKQTIELSKKNKHGWQRIAGKVIGIKNTRKSRYLNLTHNFSVRIKKEHSQYFDNLDLLIGKRIEVRGWVNRYKNGFSMLVKHSNAIKVLE